MDSIIMRKRRGLMTAAALSWSLALLAAAGQGGECLVKEGTRLAMAGDSITWQKLYSKFIETYLVACVPVTNISVIQYGCSGDSAGRFLERMEPDLLMWKPTLVTTCFGMNDGRYQKYDEASIGNPYATNMWKIVAGLKAIGVPVVVGGPGVVDADTYTGTKAYNETLAKLSAIASNVAAANNLPFADVHQAMMSAMIKSKSAYGPAYHVAGGDGVHPGQNGHLVMAYAFLRAMGLDGQIGTVEVDWKGGATASAGHKVLSISNGVVTVESARYPFCFWGAEKDPNGTISILPFVPFQDDLNRFVLQVKNLPTGSADVKWGQQQKTFTADQLGRGINLAAEFPDNPFRPAFQKVMDQVAAKQSYESTMITGPVTYGRFLKKEFNNDSEIAGAVDAINGKFLTRHSEYNGKVRAAVTPVQHAIVIMPK